MISCIIIDDEKKARETFEMIVQRYLPEKLRVVGMADSVKEGVYAIHKYNPELVFLDIEMPVESGFKLFDYFETVTFEIIFLTAYKNYAIDAIRFAAFDYLLKPLDFTDLMSVINRYEKKKKDENNNARIQALLSNLNIGAAISSKIALPTLSGYQMEKIINMNFVKSYNRTDGYKILLENGVELEIATRRNEEFVKALTKAKG